MSSLAASGSVTRAPACLPVDPAFALEYLGIFKSPNILTLLVVLSNLHTMARDKGRSLRHRRTSPDQPARKTRSAAAVNASRKRSIYHEPDTDEEVYRDDTESDEEDDFQPQHTEPQRPSKRRKVAQRKQKPAAQSRPINSSQKSTKRHPRAKKKEHLFSHIHSTPVKKEDHEARFKGQSDNRVPAWTSLPIEILRDIFIFASHPIHEQTTTAR